MKRNKSGRPSLDKIMDPQKYVFKFDISSLFKDKPLLVVILLWPDGEFEKISVQLGGSEEYISIPLPKIKLPEDDSHKEAEELTAKPLLVTNCSVSDSEIYLRVNSKTFIYELAYKGLNINAEGEAGGAYLYGLRNYFFPYVDFNKKAEWSPKEITEFITFYPRAKNFMRVLEMSSNLLFEGQTAKLGRGQKSLETRNKTRIKNYALYNLVQSQAPKSANIDDALVDLANIFQEEFELSGELDAALRRAYYRAKKEVEASHPILSANVFFCQLTPIEPDCPHNAYVLLTLPASE
jgi:hypothetical protein